MREGHVRFLAALSIFLLGTMCQAKTKLMLYGGGEPPLDANKLFSKWAGATDGTILVISWASGPNKESENFPSRFRPDFEGKTIVAPRYDQMPAQKERFLKELLPQATAVFFTGGDQNFIMDILKDADITKALTTAYHRGIPFGGTSAGTAIMSNLMFTGHEDLTVIDPLVPKIGKGLGLLPDVVLDQHFLKRMRHNRLFSAMFKSREPLGIGIDEKAALAVDDNARFEVLGEDLVMIIDNAHIPGKFVVEFLKAGDKYDLTTRRKE